MTPAQYHARWAELLAHVDRLRAARDALAAHDPDVPAALPPPARAALAGLDPAAERLRTPDLAVAVVGGFSAGKSTLVNALLGRALLPEAPGVTTAAPTVVRATGGDDAADLHFLPPAGLDALAGLFRAELAAALARPDLAAARAAATDPAGGRARGLAGRFARFLTDRAARPPGPRGPVRVSLAEAARAARDEAGGLFLDRVEVRARGTPLPPDIALVDLPGVGGPNPRHRAVAREYVASAAHAVVFVLLAARPFDRDEAELADLARAGDARAGGAVFWVLNRWDALSPGQQTQAAAGFDAALAGFGVRAARPPARTNALHGLLAQVAARGDAGGAADPGLGAHLRDYAAALPGRYGGCHLAALRASGVPALRADLFGRLGAVRATVLGAVAAAARDGVCAPLLPALARAAGAAEAAAAAPAPAAAAPGVVPAADRWRAEVVAAFRAARAAAAVAGADGGGARALADGVRARAAAGGEADPAAAAAAVVADGDLRSAPYHLEVELRVAAAALAGAKRDVRRLAAARADAAYAALAGRVGAVLAAARAELGEHAPDPDPVAAALAAGRARLADRVDGAAAAAAAGLDAVLGAGPGWAGPGPVLAGLARAARAADPAARAAGVRAAVGGPLARAAGACLAGVGAAVGPVVVDLLRGVEGAVLGAWDGGYRAALGAAAGRAAEASAGPARAAARARAGRLRGVARAVEQAAAGLAGFP